MVVNFWASWCVPCREEMPALEEVSQGYAEAGKPVTVIGVDASDVRSEAAKFLAEVGVTYPTVYDQQGLRGGVAASWTVTGLPQTWFVARDGSRAGRIAGRAHRRRPALQGRRAARRPMSGVIPASGQDDPQVGWPGRNSSNERLPPGTA